MPKKSKEQYVLVSAKTDKGKDKISYHGEKWLFREEVTQLKFTREPGPFLIFRSRDGTRVLFVKKQDDTDIAYRFV